MKKIQREGRGRKIISKREREKKKVGLRIAIKGRRNVTVRR